MYKLRADGSKEPSLSSPSYISMVSGRDYSFKLDHTSSNYGKGIRGKESKKLFR